MEISRGDKGGPAATLRLPRREKVSKQVWWEGELRSRSTYGVVGSTRRCPLWIVGKPECMVRRFAASEM
jgi:hypothetical protein